MIAASDLLYTILLPMQIAAGMSAATYVQEHRVLLYFSGTVLGLTLAVAKAIKALLCDDLATLIISLLSLVDNPRIVAALVDTAILLVMFGVLACLWPMVDEENRDSKLWNKLLCRKEEEAQEVSNEDSQGLLVRLGASY